MKLRFARMFLSEAANVIRQTLPTQRRPRRLLPGLSAPVLHLRTAGGLLPRPSQLFPEPPATDCLTAKSRPCPSFKGRWGNWPSDSASHIAPRPGDGKNASMAPSSIGLSPSCSAIGSTTSTRPPSISTIPSSRATLDASHAPRQNPEPLEGRPSKARPARRPLPT